VGKLTDEQRGPVGAWIRRVRRSLGDTQEAFSERTGLSFDAIRKLEAGERGSHPPARTIRLVAAVASPELVAQAPAADGHPPGERTSDARDIVAPTTKGGAVFDHEILGLAETLQAMPRGPERSAIIARCSLAASEAMGFHGAGEGIGTSSAGDESSR